MAQESMYSDAEDRSVSAPADETSDKPSAETRTALVPKSFCPGMSVGDEFTVRISAEHDDEFALEYVEPEESEPEVESESAAEAPMMAGGGGSPGLDSMME